MGAHDDRNENEWIGSHAAKIDASHGVVLRARVGRRDGRDCGGVAVHSTQACSASSDEASTVQGNRREPL